jgi:hypothetical protein
MTKYNENPWWIFEMHKIEPDLQLITNIAKNKEAKQEKENAENACHKIPMTQPSPLSASLSNTITKPKLNPNPNTIPSPPLPPLSTCPIKDSPGSGKKMLKMSVTKYR